jgi:DNA polymerase I-like protein with 3'-5' exonuclease and polymerase domains
MARYIFDLETDGLLDTVSKIHSLVIIDVDTGEMLSFVPETVKTGLWYLNTADELIGHNVIAYDVPVLKKLGLWDGKAKVTDTLVLSRMLYPDIGELDVALMRKKALPPKLFASHSLKAWGHRIGEYKDDFDGGDWSTWSPEMQTYCEQDVHVTLELYKRLMALNPSPLSVDLEHKVARVCFDIERAGFLFDDAKAVQLWQELQAKRDVMTAELKTLFPPWQSLKKVKGETEFIAKRDNKKLGRIKGQPYAVPVTVEFNPGSRDHIADRLADKYKWTPAEFTNGGKAQIDETVLASLPYPEAKALAQLFLLEKRIGQIATGNEAWLKKQASDKRVHGRYNPNGTVTGRSSHFSPNIAQVPKVGKPYGLECRSLFKASPGYKIVGADLQGLELRCLGHFMSRWDKGVYSDLVVSGDPHTANMHAMQLSEFFPDKKVQRDKSKTIVYAVLYGAGDAKVGSVVGKGPQVGKRLKERLKANLKGFGQLVDAVAATAVSRGTLKGLDGRTLKVRSKHAALNTLLQSCGAILCKAWMVTVAEYLRKAGYQQGAGRDYAIVAWVHDELQIEVREGLEEEVGKIVLKAANDAGKSLGFVPPLDAEYKVGMNWAETH